MSHRIHRPDRVRFVPGSDLLEPRQLLSGARHATHADLLPPPPVETASATAILQSQAGADFQKLAADLQNLEQASHVTPGQYATLEYDATTIDMAITTSGLPGRQAAIQLDAMQNVLDQSFLAGTYRGSGWSELESKVSANLHGVMVNYVLTQAQVAATTPHGVISNSFVQQTFDQMKTIARQAHVTAAEHAQILADEQAVIKDLGPTPDTNLGGAAPRNPLTVWLDSQVPNFVHARTPRINHPRRVRA
ncbi:MAG: hypothetical protein ACP5XB_25820 [Isosphaeraceae bacterium]